MIFSYNPLKGVQYALKYALNSEVPADQALFYYELGGDCTNFVCQCVWAAYGGWLPNADISVNRTRVKKDIRQVTGVWYGSAQNVGSNRWCRVIEFHDFVTNQNKVFGPVAISFGNKPPSSFSPSEIRVGDVIQLVVEGYSWGNYGHSLYVTSVGNTWDDVKICCHTYDRKDSPFSEFVNSPEIYPKMRVLRFLNANFSD